MPKLKTEVKMYRNILNNITYRKTDKYGIECKCVLTGEWYPSPIQEQALIDNSVTYTITQETKLGRFLRKLGLRK